MSRFEVICPMGRGKYSDVYEGIEKSNGSKVVIKFLKPVRELKISREIKILEAIVGGKNLV